MKKIEYKTNEKIGNCFFIKEIEPYVSSNGQKKRKVLVKCGECDNIFETLIESLKSKKTISCGCIRKEILSKTLSKTKTTHGLRYNVLYRTWNDMKQRCYNSNHKSYKHYGGRGITVCDKWLGKQGIINFINDMGSKPTPLHSIDRYPNNDGNYEPNNCRWGTSKQQIHNRRKKIKI